MKRDLCEAMARDDYRDAARSIEERGNSISHQERPGPGEHAARVAEKVGTEVRRELFGPDAVVGARSEAPPNRPGLLIVSPDGSRLARQRRPIRRAPDLRLPHERGGREEGGRWRAPRYYSGRRCGSAARGRGRGRIGFRRARPARARPRLARRSGPHMRRGPTGRENKVGVVIRAERGFVDAEGEWHPPKELVKTYVATTGDVHAFGRDLRTEAERRGYERAEEVVFVADNGHGIPEMIEREFGDREVHRVTDFEHSRERLADAAAAASGADEVARRRLYFGWKSWLWEGRVEEIAGAMAAEAGKFAPRPEKLAELDEGSPERTLWGHAFYFEKWPTSMTFEEVRPRREGHDGLPGVPEAGVAACVELGRVGVPVCRQTGGQVGERVKHARMRWTRRRAEGVHQIKAAILSQDGRWDRRWPGPIPVLETPPLAALAPAA